MKLSRKRLAVLLCAVLLFCALPLSASALRGGDHTGYTALDTPTVTADQLTGKVYLECDVAVVDNAGEPADVTLSSDLTLCLNGHNLSFKSLTVSAGTLTLENCNGNGNNCLVSGDVDVVSVLHTRDAVAFGDVTLEDGAELITGYFNDDSVTSFKTLTVKDTCANLDGTVMTGLIDLGKKGSLDLLQNQGLLAALDIDPENPNLTIFLGATETEFLTKSNFSSTGAYLSSIFPNTGSPIQSITAEQIDGKGFCLVLHLAPRITVKSGNSSLGTVSAAVGSSSGTVLCPGANASVELTPTPAVGCEFLGWFDESGNEVTSPYTFPGTADVTLTAKFDYALTVTDAYGYIFNGVYSNSAVCFSAKRGTNYSNLANVTPADLSNPTVFIRTSEPFLATPDSSTVTEPGAFEYTFMDEKGGTATATLYVNGIIGTDSLEYTLGDISPDITVAYGTPVCLFSQQLYTGFSVTKPSTPGTWYMEVSVYLDETNHIPPLEAMYQITVKYPAPTVTADPAAPFVVGADTELTAAQTGNTDPNAFSWVVKKDGSAMTLTDAGANPLELTALEGGKYEAVVTANGEESEPFVFTVNDIGDIASFDGWNLGDTPTDPTDVTSAVFGDVIYEYSADNGATWKLWSAGAPDAAGDYLLRGRVEAGTDSAGLDYAAVTSNTVSFTVTNDPSVTVSADREKLSVTDADPTVKLTATVSNATNPTYQWQRNGEDITDATAAEYTDSFTAGGEYKYVCVMNGAVTSNEIIVKVNDIKDVAIDGWVYGDSPKSPAGTPCFGSVKFTYSVKGENSFSDAVPTMPGSYELKASVEEGTDYTAVEKTVEFRIEKAENPELPALIVDAERVKGLKDGWISGLDSTMEIYINGTWYPCDETVLNGTSPLPKLEGGKLSPLSPATYYVRYRETDTHKASGNANVQVRVGGPIPADARFRVQYKQLSAVPDSLSRIYGSLDDLQSTMLDKLCAYYNLTKSTVDYSFFDIRIQFLLKEDEDVNANWHTVTAELFPANGVKVTIPIPDGLKTNHSKLYVEHMFVEDVNGKNAGDVEYPVVSTSNGKFTVNVMGTSPLLLGGPDNNGNGGGNSGGGTGNGGAVPTGDTNNPLLWACIFGGAVIGLAAFLLVPKLKKKKDDTRQ